MNKFKEVIKKMPVFFLHIPRVYFFKWDHDFAYCFDICSFNLRNIF